MGPEENIVRRCGRPTRSGDPCHNQLSRFEIACKTHATDHDREVAEAYQRGFNEGREFGYDMAAGGEELKIEYLERRITQLEQELDDEQRYYEIDGDQVVTVGRYAYRWRGDTPLEVGDHVWLPENWLSRVKDGPGSRSGIVTALGTTYRGALSLIAGRAPAEDG